jgi:hypothetical protein
MARMTASMCPEHPDYDGIGDPPDDDCYHCAYLQRLAEEEG